MLSKKMAFSLMSLITLFAFAFVAGDAFAAKKPFEIKIAGAATVTYATVTTAVTVDLMVESAHKLPVLTIAGIKGDGSTPASDDKFDETGDVAPNVTVTAFDRQGITIVPTTAIAVTDRSLADYPMKTGKKRQLRIAITQQADVDPNTDKGRIASVVIGILGGFMTADPTVLATDGTDTELNLSKAVFHTITLSTAPAANPSRPMVVSVQRLRPGSQTVVAAFQEAEVTGPFDVRIVLTEKAFKPGTGDAINAADIEVTNGTASNFVTGVPFKQQGTGGGTILPHPSEGMYEYTTAIAPTLGLPPLPAGPITDDFVPAATGTDDMYYQYRVTITPHRRATEVKVSVKTFHDNASPYRNSYQPIALDSKLNGREQLTLTVNIPKHDLEAGYRIYLPHEEKPDFPKNGHYILARNKEGSFINYSHHEDTATPDRENLTKEQTLAQLKYNVRETVAGTPAARARTADEPQFELPNLEAFLANQGTIHLISYVRDDDKPKYKMGDAYISEVMWGTDASQDPVSNSNWIEIRRDGDKIDVGAQDWALWFYEAHETPPTTYPANSSYEGAIGQPGEIIDIIGTKASDTGLSWSIAGKGQSGRSNIDIARALQHVLTPTTPLISMYRMMDATDMTKPADGTMASSWVQTAGPSVNLTPGREDAIIATPGAAPFDTPDDVKVETEDAAAKAKAAADLITNTGTIPKAGQIYISEVMFAGGGTLPQWIEISNGSRTEEINLSGWTITVDNAAADADVSIGASAKFTISKGTTVSMSGQDDTPSTILVVTEKGRNSFSGPKAASQVIVLDEPGSMTEIDLILAGVTKGKYTLLSGMAFLITLAPPEPRVDETAAEKTARLTAEKAETVAAKTTRQAAEARAAAERKRATDTVGNLGADGAAAWALPMSEEGGRSSIIRRHIQVARGPSEPEDGTMMDNWALASETAFAQVTHIRASSYYGAANDVGTPGFRAGGALPVELSHFRPARDKVTDAVVITWSTQSELNNAGFFIKRSNQPDSEFKVINATMIAGAGTTSEKQFYTYTDTTAQPNVVYYYQIEDVSLDGNHQTLTRGIRLKGHVSVAGKATLTWGELKTSHE